MKAPLQRRLKNHLGQSRSGRVILHAFCVVKHPERARWHWNGIVRELVPARTEKTA